MEAVKEAGEFIAGIVLIGALALLVIWVTLQEPPYLTRNLLDVLARATWSVATGTVPALGEGTDSEGALFLQLWRNRAIAVSDLAGTLRGRGDIDRAHHTLGGTRGLSAGGRVDGVPRWGPLRELGVEMADRCGHRRVH